MRLQNSAEPFRFCADRSQKSADRLTENIMRLKNSAEPFGFYAD
jgi:hypothetical protein